MNLLKKLILNLIYGMILKENKLEQINTAIKESNIQLISIN